MHRPRQRCRHAACVRRRPAVVPGGPHHAEPSFRRAAGHPGDLPDPIGVCDQVRQAPAGRASSRSSRPATTRQCTRSTLPSEVPGGSWPRPAPPRSSSASRETGIQQRLTYQPRRGHGRRHRYSLPTMNLAAKLQRRLRFLPVTDFSAVSVLGWQSSWPPYVTSSGPARGRLRAARSAGWPPTAARGAREPFD